MDKTKIKEAVTLFEQGDYEDAIEIYKSLIKEKDDPDLHFDLGLCYSKLKDYRKAQEEWLKVLEKEPNDYTTLYNLAKIHSICEQDDIAISYINKALKIKQDYDLAKELKKQIQELHRGETPYLTYTLIGLNLFIYFFVLGFNDWFINLSSILRYSFSGYALNNFELYKIVTSMFAQANLVHLFMNLLGLYYLGRFLESAIGTIKFALLYFGSGILGAWLQAIIVPNAQMVGASGAIFGLIGLLGLLLPLLSIDVFFIIRMPVIVFTAIYTVFTLFIDAGKGILGFAHFAHLGGLLFGLFFSFYINKDRAKEVILYWVGIFATISLSFIYLINPLIQSFPFKFTQAILIKFVLIGISFGLVYFLIDKLKEKGHGLEDE